MATPNVQTQSGNRIQIEFDNQVVGLLQNVEPSDDYGEEPASGIGDIHAIEYVPSMARHTLQVSTMVLKTKNLRALGLIPENGDAKLQGLVFNISVVDKDTQKTLRTYIGCSYNSGNLTVEKHRITMESGSFNCLDVRGTGL